MSDIGSLATTSSIGWTDVRIKRNSAGVASIYDVGTPTNQIIFNPGGSTIFQLQVGGTNKATIDNAGNVLATQYNFSSQQGFRLDEARPAIYDSNTVVARFHATSGLIVNNLPINLSPNSLTVDTSLYRNSAGNLGLHGVGADAALFIYSDDSDVGANPTNYEALKLTCDTSCNGTISMVGNGLTTPGTLTLQSGFTVSTIGDTSSRTLKLNAGQLFFDANNNASTPALLRDGNNTIGVRGYLSTLTQGSVVNIYSDLADPAGNYERLSLSMDTSGNATIATEKGGTGTAGDIIINAPSTKTIHFKNAGNSVLQLYGASVLTYQDFRPQTDGTLFIGQDANSFRGAAFNQGTNDDGFINFRATADADATSAITTLTTPGTLDGFIQIEINGVKKWIPFYSDPS